MTFTLHPDLVRDGIAMGNFTLCQLLLIKDSTYPWFVLVPKRQGISDTIDLSADDHAKLWAESRAFSTGIMAAFAGDKLNVAALGNMTPQLHVHHVVRYTSDPAWPGPIWGKVPMQPYKQDGIETIRKKLAQAGITGLTLI